MKETSLKQVKASRELLVAILLIVIVAVTGMGESSMTSDLANKLPPTLASVQANGVFTPFY